MADHLYETTCPFCKKPFAYRYADVDTVVQNSRRASSYRAVRCPNPQCKQPVRVPVPKREPNE